MGTNNRQKRAAKRRKEERKRRLITACSNRAEYKFRNHFPITVSEAEGFPCLYRDIRLAYPPRNPLAESTGLKDLEFELLMYDSIQDRAVEKNPLTSLVAKIHKSFFLCSTNKSFIQSASIYSNGNIRFKELCIWRLQIELIEYIEPGSLYGDWYALQGDNSEGLVSIFIDADILVSRIPASRTVTRIKSKGNHDPDDLLDYFHVETFAFSEESKANMDKLSNIQIDAAWFLMVAICTSVPGLSAPAYLLQSSKSETQGLLTALSRYENSLMPKLKAVTNAIRGIKCDIESLEINANDSTTKLYVNNKSSLAKMRKDRDQFQRIICEINESLKQKSEELERAIKLKTESIRSKDADNFKNWYLREKILRDDIQLLNNQLSTAKTQKNDVVSLIEKKERALRLLESQLGIDTQINEIRNLRGQEVLLMTEIDRCLMERIILSSGYNAWALLNNQPRLH